MATERQTQRTAVPNNATTTNTLQGQWRNSLILNDQHRPPPLSAAVAASTTKQRCPCNSGYLYEECCIIYDTSSSSYYPQITQALCRNFGSAKGCRYGSHCEYSHEQPDSIPLCHFIEQQKHCFLGKRCSFRHHIYEYEQQQIEVTRQEMRCPATVTVVLLLELQIEYFSKRTDSTQQLQYSAEWTDCRYQSEKYRYHCHNAVRLLSHLRDNKGYGVIADIGLFAHQKSMYSNHDWHQWLQQDNAAYLQLSRQEQTALIVKIREVLNCYNAHYKYMTKKFHPWTYYRTKLIVYGFLNTLMRDQVQEFAVCPDEIRQMIFAFYYEQVDYQLFQHTETVKLSGDNTLIQMYRKRGGKVEENERVSLPLIAYKIMDFAELKIKCRKIAPDCVFSIGLIPDLKHVRVVNELRDARFWPFDLTEREKKRMERPIQFCFGGDEKDESKRKLQEKDVYCGVLRDGDVLTLRPAVKEYRSVFECNVCLTVQSAVNTHKKRVYRIEVSGTAYQWNKGYPAIAFDYNTESAVLLDILNVDSRG